MNTLFSLRPVLAVDKGEHDYVNVSASAGQICGEGGIWKIVRTSGKILATPRIVLYSSPVSIFIPSESQQTEKSGEGIEFSLRENMGLRWPEPIYMCVGYVLKSRFSAGKMWSISMILLILNNEWSNFKKLLFILL